MANCYLRCLGDLGHRHPWRPISLLFRVIIVAAILDTLRSFHLDWVKAHGDWLSRLSGGFGTDRLLFRTFASFRWLRHWEQSLVIVVEGTNRLPLDVQLLASFPALPGSLRLSTIDNVVGRTNHCILIVIHLSLALCRLLQRLVGP